MQAQKRSKNNDGGSDSDSDDAQLFKDEPKDSLPAENDLNVANVGEIRNEVKVE